MPIRLVIPNETAPGERRIALEPGVANKLSATGVKIVMEQGAALSSYFKDEDFADVETVADTAAMYKDADLVFKVQPPTLDEIASVSSRLIVNKAAMRSRYQGIQSLIDRLAAAVEAA